MNNRHVIRRITMCENREYLRLENRSRYRFKRKILNVTYVRRFYKNRRRKKYLIERLLFTGLDLLCPMVVNTHSTPTILS